MHRTVAGAATSGLRGKTTADSGRCFAAQRATETGAFLPQTSERMVLDRKGELLDNTPNASWPDFNAPTRSAPVFARIGRALFILTAVSLMSMPLTEHLWTWDHFLQGGQDFEMSTILVLSFLCLVLVLSKHEKQGVDSLFATWCHLAFISHHHHFVRNAIAGTVLASGKERVPSPVLSKNNNPLRI